MRVSSTNQEMCVLSVAWSLGRRDAFTLGLLLKFIQAAKLVKANLAHSSVRAGTTPFESRQRVSRSSSTKRSEWRHRREVEGVTSPSPGWAWSY